MVHKLTLVVPRYFARSRRPFAIMYIYGIYGAWIDTLNCDNRMSFLHDDVIKWKHFSALLAICAENSPVTGEFPAQRPVTRSFEVFFDLRLIKRLSKQWRGWWLETPSPHYDVTVMHAARSIVGSNDDDMIFISAPTSSRDILQFRWYII